MPTPTYTPLATVTLSSSASSVTFSNIPSSYRDLIVVVTGTNSANAFITLRLNGDTGSNYSMVWMQGSGLGSSSNSVTSQVEIITSANNVGTALKTALINIMDYSATDKHKTLLATTNGENGGTRLTAGLVARWANTSAINSVRVYDGNGSSYLAGSTFNLYGVLA
jgi:hypothetical protein